MFRIDVQQLVNKLAQVRDTIGIPYRVLDDGWNDGQPLRKVDKKGKDSLLEMVK